MSFEESQPAWRVIKPSGRWGPPLNLREVLAHRELGLLLALRDVKLRYRQTAFGIAWALIQPLVGIGVFTLALGNVEGVPTDGVPYALFITASLSVWLFISAATGNAAESLVDHPDLVTKAAFPRMLAPVAAAAASIVELLVMLVLVAVALAAYAQAPPLQVVTLPIWLAAGFLLAVGVGLWLCAANVLYRDVRYALGFLLLAWLFLSPVLTSSAIVHGGWLYVYSLNPAVGIMDGARWALLGTPAPGAELVVSAASLATLLVTGAKYFRAAEQAFADRI